MSRYLRRLATAAVLVGALIVPFTAASSAYAYTYAGWQNSGYSGTLLFWGNSSPPGTNWDFANNVLTSVQNNSGGGKLCLYDGGGELMHLNPGISISNLSSYSANDQADDATLTLYPSGSC